MIAHWDIIQKSADWYRIRYGKIGGSTAKQLFVDSDTLLDEILACQLEPFEIPEDSYESSAMARGNELEPHERLKLSEYTGLEFLECGWLQSSTSQIMGVSPDGITQDLRVSCEIKCPSSKKHISYLRGKVLPLDHVHQCVQYFAVNPLLENHYFMSFRPECRFDMFVFEMNRYTVVNLGTKAKPVNKTIKDWVEIYLKRAAEIEANIPIEIKALEF